ncbi:MAG: universal stress protein [Thermoplasmatota archaeon]
MYSKVVVPTDGSEIGEKGVEEGLKVAQELEIPALAVYVVDLSEYDHVESDSVRDSVKNSKKKVGERALRFTRKKAHELGVDIQTQLLLGKPYKRILDVSKKDDIIFICSHGASGFSEIFFGSTTDKVVKNAECTVAVVRG